MALSKWVCAMLTIFCVAAHANEGGEGEGEKKAEGESEKKAEKKESAAPAWMEAQQKLLALKAKVATKEHAIEELIKEKQAERNPDRAREIVNQMKKEHKELMALAEEYDQQRNFFRYRFPEKGMKEPQKYKRIEVKPLDVMENETGIAGRLKHTNQKVRKAYGLPEPKPAPSATGESKAEAEKKKNPSSITEPQVLSK